MPLVARLAERFGLPGNRYIQIRPCCCCGPCLKGRDREWRAYQGRQHLRAQLLLSHPGVSADEVRLRCSSACSPESVDAARDKSETRAFMARAKLPTPRNMLIAKPEDVEAAGNHVGFPAGKPAVYML